MAKQYKPSFKLQVVLESLQRDTTIESVRKKYNVPKSVLSRWRREFQASAHHIFDGSLNSNQPKAKKVKPEDSPEQLKAIIGDLSIENALLKKALSVWA